MADQGDERSLESRGSSLMDRIYELLAGIEVDLANIRRINLHQRIDVFEYGSILDAVGVLGQYNLDLRLGIPVTEVAKFHAMKGSLRAEVVLRVGERAVTLLHELEGQVRAETDANGAATGQSDAPPTPPATATVYAAKEWLPVNRRTNANLIAEISSLIDEAIRLARSTNLPPERQALSEIERAQLIALLETALQLLKAPLVERGLLESLTEATTSGATRAVGKGTELAMGYGLGKLGELLAKLIKSISEGG